MKNSLITTKVAEKIDIINPLKQEVWRWPGVVNFVLGGAAAGFFLLNIFINAYFGKAITVYPSSLFKLLAPFLVCAGLLALTVEAGRPLRAPYLLYNLRTSWMARETLFGSLFIIFSSADWYFSQMLLTVLAALSAMGFLLSQGFIIYRARAVTSWNVPLMPVLFLTSGLTLGVGLMIVTTSFYQLLLDRRLLIAGLTILVIDLFILGIYMGLYLENIFRTARRLLRPAVLTFTIAMGYLAPIIIFLMLLSSPEGESGTALQLLAGILIIAGGIHQKASIVLWTGYMRDITMVHQKALNKR